MTLIRVKNVIRTAAVAALLMAIFTGLRWIGWLSVAFNGSLCVMITMNDIRGAFGLPRARWFDEQGITVVDILRDRVRRTADNRQRLRLVKPPVGRLDSAAFFLCSQKTYDRVFKPARADLINEWQAAFEAGQLWKVRWICWGRGPYTMLSHMLFQLPVSLMNVIKSFLG